MKKRIIGFALILVVALGFSVTAHAELGDGLFKRQSSIVIFENISTTNELGDRTGK